MNNIIFNDDATKWYSKKEICSICKVGHSAFERFILILTNEDQKYIQKRPSRKGGHLYAEPILQQFQLWLKKNAMNAGGQRTEGSIIKQEIHDIVDNSGYKYTKEDICGICNCSISSFEHFAPQELTERDFISVGSSHKKLYAEPILQKFQLWLKRNAMNAGGQRTEGSIIKQDNQQDLFIGCVATKGTPDEIRSLAQHLQNFANQKELLEQTKQQNNQLKLENYNLSEENNYLKKLSNFQSTQLDYYTKKYHSWYDNYENY